MFRNTSATAQIISSSQKNDEFAKFQDERTEGSVAAKAASAKYTSQLTSLKPQVDNELKMKENAFKKDIEYSKKNLIWNSAWKNSPKVVLASEDGKCDGSLKKSRL